MGSEQGVRPGRQTGAAGQGGLWGWGQGGGQGEGQGSTQGKVTNSQADPSGLLFYLGGLAPTARDDWGNTDWLRGGWVMNEAELCVNGG